MKPTTRRRQQLAWLSREFSPKTATTTAAALLLLLPAALFVAHQASLVQGAAATPEQQASARARRGQLQPSLHPSAQYQQHFQHQHQAASQRGAALHQPTTTVIHQHQNQQHQHQHQHQQHQQQHLGHRGGGSSRFVTAPSQPAAQRNFEICQLPSGLAGRSKCEPKQEHDFKRIVTAEFQLVIRKSSDDLLDLLASYQHELRSHAHELLNQAGNATVGRLASQQVKRDQQQQQQQQPAELARATERLFATLRTYLDQAAAGAGQVGAADTFELLLTRHRAPPPSAATPPATGGAASPATALGDAELAHAVGAFFHRLHVLQAKRLLDAKLAPLQHADADCLAANLPNQGAIDGFLWELAQANYTARGPDAESGRLLAGERAQLAASLRHSAEFARTLMSSVGAFREMLWALRERAPDWMSGQACQRALVQMTLCPQCHPEGGFQATSKAPGFGLGLHQQQAAATGAPCESYCLNVARGCMNDLWELDRFWTDTVRALGQLSSNMIMSNNLESVMLNLDEKLDKFSAQLSRHFAPNAPGAQATIGKVSLSYHIIRFYLLVCSISNTASERARGKEAKSAPEQARPPCVGRHKLG